jgi:hypothetical protein
MTMADDDDRFDPTDPYNRETQTFPKLDGDQLDRIGRFGETEDFPKGAHLFTRGERSVDFFVVVEGSIEITTRAQAARRASSTSIASASSPASSTCSTIARSWSAASPVRTAASSVCRAPAFSG